MPTPSPRFPASLSRRLEPWLIAATLAAVGWFYYWTVATAGGFEPAGDADYYHLLVRGYRHGHLYLDHAPAPEMLTLADPYDPAQNGPYRLPDATYFQGHYYLYFGAAPAVLLMWPFSALTGTDLPTGAAVFCFCVLGFLAASGLWLTIRRRYFPDSAAWTAVAGILMLGLATHVLALARRPTHYELPIAASYAFTMLALGAIYAAIHGRRPVLALGTAGLLIGWAAASRPPALFGAAMLLPVLWFAWRKKATWWWRGALAAGAGLGCCGVAMLWHNSARFGHALEFGQNYQLTSARELSNRHFGLDYMAHNLRVYFFGEVQWSWEFPFVAAQVPATNIPDYAGSEEMAGMLVTLPFLWWALAAPLAWRRRAEETEREKLRAMLGAIGGLFLGVGIFLLAFFSTTERYATEFAPALGLLAACGWLTIERWGQQRRLGAAVPAMGVVNVAATVLAGVLLSFDYHGRSFAREDPATWGRLERASHAVLSRAGRALGQFDGPRILKVRFRERPAGTRETFWRATDPRAAERLVVEYLGAREIRFGYARGDAPVRWGRRLTWEPEHTHTIEVQLPSLYRAPGGFMRAVRAADEARERSSVAVWFSGGRALGEIVAPLSAGIEPGGVAGADFSGELRVAGARLWREDEISDAPEPVLAGPPGGVLRLRVVLPASLAAAGEPLFAAGVLYGSDVLLLQPLAGDAARFVFDHFNSPPLTSAPVRLAPGSEHVIELELPSGAAGDTFSGAATGEVRVRLDGAEVIRGRSACFAFAAGNEAVGRNPFGIGSATRFRGWLLEARWTGVPAGEAPEKASSNR